MAELTDNINFFQPTGFKVSVDRKNYPNIEFFAQSVNLPSLSLAPAELPFRQARLPMPGDTLSFGELTINMLLDEDLNSYKEMYNWMVRLVKEKHVTAQEALLNDKVASTTDIIITALTSHNNSNVKIQYHDAVPTSLGDVNVEANNSSVEYIVVPISFRFTYFELI